MVVFPLCQHNIYVQIDQHLHADRNAGCTISKWDSIRDCLSNYHTVEGSWKDRGRKNTPPSTVYLAVSLYDNTP